MPATPLSHGALRMCIAYIPGSDPLHLDRALASELTLTDGSLSGILLGTIILPQSRL